MDRITIRSPETSEFLKSLKERALSLLSPHLPRETMERLRRVPVRYMRSEDQRVVSYEAAPMGNWTGEEIVLDRAIHGPAFKKRALEYMIHELIHAALGTDDAAEEFLAYVLPRILLNKKPYFSHPLANEMVERFLEKMNSSAAKDIHTLHRLSREVFEEFKGKLLSLGDPEEQRPQFLWSGYLRTLFPDHNP